MSLKTAILDTGPTSYWPLDDVVGDSCHDKAGLHDAQYSQPYANALTIATWICPLTLDNAQTTGTRDQYVHFMEKAVDSTTEVEWAMRLYNKANPSRHSRLSFYTFKPVLPPGEGNGAYMEYGVSANDMTPVETGGWLFLVGQAEP